MQKYQNKVVIINGIVEEDINHYNDTPLESLLVEVIV